MTNEQRARRIAVDLTPMQMGGVNGGAKPAALGLVELLAVRGRFDVTVFIKASYSEALPFEGVERIEIVHVDDRFLLSQERMFGGKEPWSLARATGCDLLFAPFGDPLLWERGLPTVTQRYDLQHLDHPEFFAREELRHRGHSDRRLKDLSAHVVTSSEFSRATFTSKLAIEADRISVIPLPLPAIPEDRGAAAREVLLSNLGLTECTYLYYPANFWPHKNHALLVDAYAAATTDIGAAAPHLVLTGDTLGTEEMLRAHARNLGVADRLHILGFVSDEERDAIWRGCRALIFPSLYEGFGIPMQEAMLYGKAIAASRACSIPEVGGDAAIYFDGRDVDDMARAIRTLIDEAAGSEDFARERELQLRKFDPDTVAEQYIALFDRILEEIPARTAGAPVEIDVAITGCDALGDVDNTLAGLEAQEVLPRSITLVSETAVESTIVERAQRIAPTEVIVDADERTRGRCLDAALRARDGAAILLVNAGEVLLPQSLHVATSTITEFPSAWLVHGLTLGASRAGDIIWERPTEPIDRARRETRRFAPRASSLVSRRTLTASAQLDTAEFAFEALIAQAGTDSESLHVPVHLAQSPIDNPHSIGELATLDGVLRTYDVPDAGGWLIEHCETMLVAERVADGLKPDAFHIADQLLWAAPFMYALAGVPFDASSLAALKTKWRRARFGNESSLLMNPLQSILLANPRDTVLRGLVGPPLQERAAETFADPETWRRTRSISAFRQELHQASIGDLAPPLQEILAVDDNREFVVRAFEFAGNRTPCASEVQLFEDASDPAARLQALKDITNAAVARDWDAIEHAALSRTPFHVATSPEAVYPLGSDTPTTADEWFQHLEAARPHLSREADETTPAETLEASRPSTAPPSVTILCSLYNGDEYVEPYLQNMVSQEDFEDFELVIIDACSPGNERQVIEQYAEQYPNISYTRATTRIGIYEAWNLAIKQSTGRYITNANLDDARHPGSMARCRDALDRHPEIDVVYSDCFYTFLPHLPWQEIEAVGLRSNLPPATVHNMFDFNSPHCAPMWRRSLHDKHGYFDEQFKSAGDWEFWLRCIRDGLTLHKLETPLVAYFHNPRGMSTQRDTPSAREELAIRRAYRDLLIGPNAGLDPHVVGAAE